MGNLAASLVGPLNENNTTWSIFLVLSLGFVFVMYSDGDDTKGKRRDT
jgi:hypothetical protein